ncbi:MAG: helix-turn-helix domain-containing protein [Chitinophagaceae bacterium]
MLDIYDVLIIGGVFCGFITSFLLVTRGYFQLHANRLLAVVIFSIAWYGLLYLLIKTGWLGQVPGIYRIGSPLYYLIGPCSYLYTRSIVRDESRFRKWDWLHFLPALLHFAELIPFYIADAETKRKAVESIIQNFNNSYQKASGLLPALWHFLFRPVHAGIYLVFQWILLLRSLNRKASYTLHGQVFSRIRAWLFSFTGLVTIFITGLLVQSYLGILLMHSSVSITSASGYMQVIMSFAFFMICAYLLFMPDILYGTLKVSTLLPVAPPTSSTSVPGRQPYAIPETMQTVAEAAEDEDQPRKDTLFNAELVAQYASRIEQHLETHQSFRRKGLNITQLAGDLEMPVHHLSYVLNSYYKQRVNDFINQYRVNYVLRRLKEGDWQNMKLEALGAEAGFSSRTTFFVTFKKMTGLTPAEYAKQAGMAE